MRVVGIDPGSRHTGYGVVDCPERELVYVGSGRINATDHDDVDDRLPIVYDGLTTILEKFEPAEAAIESIFTAYNAQSTIKLGHARGVCVLAVQHAGLPMYDYPPATTKKNVAGHGRATKNDVQKMVKRQLQIDGNLTADAADALAVAICHFRSRDSTPAFR